MKTEIKEPEVGHRDPEPATVGTGERHVYGRRQVPQRRGPAEWAGWVISLGAVAIMLVMLVIGIVNSQQAGTTTTTTSAAPAASSQSTRAVPTVVVPL